jgi:hypothetical protein
MPPDQHTSEPTYTATAEGRGKFHDIDPRTGREPAGSGLLARAAAVRQAQESALRQAIAWLAPRSTAPWTRAAGPALDLFIGRELVPGIFDLIERRMVVKESRDEPYYSVTLEVVFDMSAVDDALGRFNA